MAEKNNGEPNRYRDMSNFGATYHNVRTDVASVLNRCRATNEERPLGDDVTFGKVTPRSTVNRSFNARGHSTLLGNTSPNDGDDNDGFGLQGMRARVEPYRFNPLTYRNEYKSEPINASDKRESKYYKTRSDYYPESVVEYSVNNTPSLKKGTNNIP